MTAGRTGWTMAQLRQARLREAGALAVTERIAAAHGITLGVLLDGSRTAPVVRCRDHALHVLRWSTLWSYPHLGHLFGMDHTSVMVAVQRHEALLNPPNPDHFVRPPGAPS